MTLRTERLMAYALRALLKPWASMVQTRVANLVYCFDSPRVRGFEATVPYFGNLRFALNTKDAIGWRIFFTGQYERETNYVLRCFCQPGNTIVEAGANNGSETILAAIHVRPTGRVYAFEPVPRVRAQLDFNVQLNRLQATVQIEALALAEKAGDTTFFLMPKEAPNQGMSSRFAFMEALERLPVTQAKLDDWMQQKQVAGLHFIKMDIQGGELGLLEGGKETMNRCRPIVYTEAMNGEQRSAGRSLEELREYFLSRGYNLWVFKANRLKPTPIIPGGVLIEGNWLAVPTEKLRQLPAAAAACLGPH